jgi:carbon-monoxide dehydrogenase large subunit
MGCKRKRVEDVRFTQGKGSMSTIIKLPGMLFGDFVRSPYPHARIKRSTRPKRAKVPGVIAVLTAEDLKPLNLHGCRRWPVTCRWFWPTARYCSRTRKWPSSSPRTATSPMTPSELVEVDYEELPVLVDPFKAMDPDAPVLREDWKARWKAPTARATPQPHLQMAVGDKERPKRFRQADVTIKEMISYHRTHPSPLETCQCVASMDKVKGRADALGHLPGAARDPHGRLADVHHSEHKIHVIAPDIGGGFGNKVGRLSGLYLLDRRLHRHRRAGEMGRGPDGEPLHHVFCPRLSHDDGTRRHQGRQDHRPESAMCCRPWRLRRLRRSVQMAGRVLQHLHRLL